MSFGIWQILILLIVFGGLGLGILAIVMLARGRK